ncbi:MAG: hypothetical protein KatS3mg090_0899 [Patescibacteria group bacterium]|nr:MAG: hypothetical protein KatS3mg090_0899 [Patescibacteria group bacterium]
MKLDYKKSFFLCPKSPFHFDGTFYKPSHFPNKLKMEEWEPGKYWQTFRVDKELFVLQVENKGTTFKPKIKITLYSQKPLNKKELEKIKQEIIWRFELDIDLKEFNKLAKKDRRFYPVFKKWMGMRNVSKNTLYELLIIAIVLQNATVRRSQQMLDALLKKFGTKVVFDKKTLWAIWLPERLKNVSEKELRDLKIGYRAKFIKRLSQDFIEGKIDEKHLRNLEKEACKQELIKLYGVGPETARILLFEAFHHFDTFDHIAPWQQKIYSRLFYGKKLVSAEKICKDILKQYGKYSMLAVHYIWEDIFWRRRNENIPWLEKEIRL